MLEGKALIEDTDMPLKTQIQAMASASQALDLCDVLDCKFIVVHIKKEFIRDMGMDGSALWDQILGVSSLILKELSSVSLSRLNFLIFKGAASSPHPLRDEQSRKGKNAYENEMYYSTKRQQFLIDQGYSFKVITGLPPPDSGPELSYIGLMTRINFLQRC